MLLDLHLLELFLLNFGAQSLDLVAGLGQFIVLILDCFPAFRDLLFKFLLESAHESVHHLITSVFNLEGPLKLGICISQLLKSLVT